MRLPIGSKHFTKNKNVNSLVILIPSGIEYKMSWNQDTIALVSCRLPSRRSIESPTRNILNSKGLAGIIVLKNFSLASELMGWLASILPDVFGNDVHDG
jgi:hypothetical protein